MVFGIGVSCRILYSIVSYLNVSCGGSITSVGEERAYFSAIVYCNYVVSVRKGFLFLFVLGMGCVLNSPEPLGSQGELIFTHAPAFVVVNNFKHLLL